MEQLNFLKDLFQRNKSIISAVLLTSFVAVAGVYYDRIDVDNIRIDGNTISSTNSNGDVTIDPNGTGNLNLPDLTASRVPEIDANNDLVSSSVTSTELGYLSGVTSGIQTQLDAKLDDFSSTTDNAVIRSDGTSGEAVQDSGVLIDDSDVVSGITQLNVDNLRLDGNVLSSTDTNGDITLTPDGTGEVDFSSIVNILTQGDLRFQDTTGGEYIGFQAPSSVTSSTTFTLPDGDGDSGQALTTNGSGVLSWADAGGGVGGGFNLENDPYAQVTEDGSINWILFDDGATTCGDLTGGTVTSTFANNATTTQILSGDYQGAFVLTHGASNLSGEGVAKAYTIPQAVKDRGYVSIKGRYSADVDLAAGDYKVCLYDVTNSQVLNISGLVDDELPGISADKAGYFSIKAYIANDTASVRLGFLRTTTDATATNFYFSDLTVSDDKVVDAPIVSEWEPYTLNITAVTSDPTKGTTSVDQAYYRRVRDRDWETEK